MVELILTILVIVVALNYKNLKSFFGTKRVKPTYTASNPPELKREFKVLFTCPHCGEKIPLSREAVKTCPKCGSNISLQFLDERMDYLKYIRLMKTSGLFCPVCGCEEVQTTGMKGAFGRTHPAYRCLKCNCTWKWQD